MNFKETLQSIALLEGIHEFQQSLFSHMFAFPKYFVQMNETWSIHEYFKSCFTLGTFVNAPNLIWD